VRLGFDDARVVGDRLVTTNTGRVAVETRIASAGGGTLRVEPARADGVGSVGRLGNVIAFPSESSTGSPPRAVLTLAAAPARRDPLSPGERAFAFGASFELDPVSQEGDTDNGNNLVQRGLAGSPSQYKLQVDHDRASCRVRGDEGSLLVEARTEVRPGRWYSVRCVRVGDHVGLEVRDLETGRTERATQSGATGSVTPPPGAEVSVGGKTNSDGGAVRLNSDQFNGEIDDVVLMVRQNGVS
jgi:hypothetical protein